ncbi:hypothetical protein JW992_06320, partial [candidate division KSB1 bacterium]|nr:hypothetical protein [candidate division KSB1 bacterium]
PVALFAGSSIASQSIQDSDLQIQTGRALFYASVRSEKDLTQAIDLFNSLVKQDSARRGVALTYIGSLTALKAKYTPWPHKKFRYAKQGLAIMEDGLRESADNIEALFIHGSTCHYLPFFFNRGDDAQRSFKRIIELLPAHYHHYEPELILNMIDFLHKEIQLSESEQKQLTAIKNRITEPIASSIPLE